MDAIIVNSAEGVKVVHNLLQYAVTDSGVDNSPTKSQFGHAIPRYFWLPPQKLSCSCWTRNLQLQNNISIFICT